MKSRNAIIYLKTFYSDQNLKKVQYFSNTLMCKFYLLLHFNLTLRSVDKLLWKKSFYFSDRQASKHNSLRSSARRHSSY